MQQQEIENFCPANRTAWREWLIKNHGSTQSVWLVIYKKKSGKQTITWSEAVDEALCFGWVDSRRKPVDSEQFIQFFCKRKPNSTWSRINKEKVLTLIHLGKMLPAGLVSIETAKSNGAWNSLDDVEAYKVPEDLSRELLSHAGAEAFFLSLSKSVRKAILQWLVQAKQPHTRQKRITEIAELAAQKRKPKQF